MVRGTVLTLVLLLSGCAAPRVVVETQEVMVPVPYRVTPPPELVEPYRPKGLPEFVSKDHEEASSCLTPMGEQKLREVIIELRLRDELWRTWAQ
jgi:hypothetical protein